MIPEGSAQCPCCDYFVLGRRGSYDPCPVCYWEDDGQDMDRLDDVSAQNHISLRQARNNFRRIGACDQSALSLIATESERRGLRREERATYN